MSIKKNKFILVLVRLVLLIFVLFACTHVSDVNIIGNSIHEATRSIITCSNLYDEDKYIATRSKLDRIMFVGDIYFSRNVKRAYDKKGVSGIIDTNYKNLLMSSDLNIGNLGCAITENFGNAEDKKYNLYTPEKYIPVLKEIGIDVLTLANNHVLDFGKDALINTMNVLKKYDISYIGAGKNKKEAMQYYLTEIAGKKYAVFSASSVIPNEDWKAGDDTIGVNNGYDIAGICNAIKDIRKDVDKIIVYMHWGDELAIHSNESQRISAHKLIDFGADLVVGTHPHIAQEIEYYKNTPIVYSLGNFIYGSTKRETILLEAIFDYNIDPEGILQIRIYPGLSNYEQVKYYWQEEDLVPYCENMRNLCDTCFIADNGYVYTFDAIKLALGLATDSEVEKENVE